MPFMIIWVGSLIFGGKKGAVQLIILDRAAYNPALTLTHHLREGAAAGNPLHASAFFRCRLMGIFEPLYIYFSGSIERYWTALNQIFMAIFSVIDFWFVQLNAFLDIEQKLNAMSLFNFGSICSGPVKLGFLGKKVSVFLCHWEKKVLPPI